MNDSAALWVLVAVLVAAVAAFTWGVFRKGRQMAGEHVFRASRLSSGNRLFPTQVAITPTSVVHYQPQWIGRLEHSIHLAHVASVRIDTNLLFSDVYIETSGGAAPIRCRGHRKGDAEAMKRLIERFQSEYYQGRPTPTGQGTV
ncbi:MAG TPA: hypothetical protein VK886_02800 [Vicinamibacterales bacterium]|nr:hypothetical protein [Vicinamibacterales bacterium]